MIKNISVLNAHILKMYGIVLAIGVVLRRTFVSTLFTTLYSGTTRTTKLLIDMSAVIILPIAVKIYYNCKH